MGRASGLSALLLALPLAGCTTVVLKSARNPDAGALSFERPLAVVNLAGYENSERVRRAGERELVECLPDLGLTPSYRHFSLEELSSLADAQRLASADGYDSLVLLWVNRVAVVPVNPHLPSDSWRSAEPSTRVRMSAAVVPVNGGKPIWSGVFERRDARDPETDVRAVVRAVARRLRADGVVSER
jgi:hypothetical protein